MGQDHDTGYKLLFSHPEMVRDLILGFVPDKWLHSIDYGTLEKIPSSYVSDDMQNRADDVVWRVKVGGQWVYLYLLIEFQSSVDKYMALRMMVYVGLLYQDLVKRGEVLDDGRLPPVLPIVLYNGASQWTAATEVGELIPPVPGLVSQFKPALKYLLVDENTYTEQDLSSMKNLVAAVFRIEHPASPETILTLLNQMGEWLSDRPDLRRMIAVWIRATLMRKREYRIVLPEVDDLQELNMGLADKLEQWAHEYEAKGVQQGMQQGLQQGRQEGESAMLRLMLTQRFGELPAEVNARLNGATEEQLKRWSGRLFGAATLGEVFHDATH